MTALCLLISGMAAATCGDTTKARPSKKINPKGRAPLVLGDSVMVFAVPHLAHRGYRANAQECRQFLTGVGIIQDKRARNRLPHLVVLALGTNGPASTGGSSQRSTRCPRTRSWGSSRRAAASPAAPPARCARSRATTATASSCSTGCSTAHGTARAGSPATACTQALLVATFAANEPAGAEE